jgi:acyl-CoA synthetase (AMP-forming)/AMP-acid ligase II
MSTGQDLVAAGALRTEETFLFDWLTAPRTDTGLYVAKDDEGWTYTSYADLALEVRQFAAALRHTGAEPGSGVALLVNEPKSFVIAFMGTLAAGLTPSPIGPRSSFRRVERYVGHLVRLFVAAKPAVVVAQEDVRDQVEVAVRRSGSDAATLFVPPAGLAAAHRLLPPAEPVRRSEHELALLQFTSGSSGTPKGVRVSWRSLTANVTALRDWLDLRSDDIYAGWLPLFHDMGLIGGMITPIAAQIGVRLMTPEQFIRSPRRWLDCFGRGDATITTSPTFGYAYAARRVAPEELTGSDFSRWRVAVLGAERIDPVALADFSDLVEPSGFDVKALVSAYGLAESTLAVTASRPGATGSVLANTAVSTPEAGRCVGVRGGGVLGRDRGTSNWLVGCGAPIGDMAVQIVDDEGRPLPDGVFGEIVISGSSLADGYVHADGTMTDFDRVGHRTGDAGFRWQGQLYVVGRIADSLKVRGAMLFAEDLEAELATASRLDPSRLAVLLGRADGADHAVVLVEEPEPQPWLSRLVATLSARTTVAVTCTVMTGRRGSIERTSSGKPRRRVMWSALLNGEPNGWTPVHGSPPVPHASSAQEKPDASHP